MIPNLFERKLCHRNDPSTSVRAAERVLRDGSVEWWQERIRNFLISHDRVQGWNCLEMANQMAAETGENSREVYYNIQRRRSGMTGLMRLGDRDGKSVWRIKHG